MSAGQRVAKRASDFVISAIAMLLLSPLFGLIALLIKLDSKGPVFFRQERAGEDGKPFRIYKFRTMIVGAYRSGARLTVKRDPRITSVGQVLRWTKLDELPQLINVLVGDMSLVGPRPEDPYFVNFYSGEQRVVLSVKPGIIGPSQIEGRDEVEKYPDGCENVEEFYIQHILPEKLARDVEYARTASFTADMGLLIGGFLRVAMSQFKSGFFARAKYRIAAGVVDVVLMAAAYVFANLLRFDFRLQADEWQYVGWTLLWVVLLKPPVFLYYGVYQRTMRWVGRRDMAAIIKAASVGSAFVVAATSLSGLGDHSRAVFIIDWAVLIFLVGGVRHAARYFLSRAPGSKPSDRYTKVLVAGAGHGADGILRSLLEDPTSKFMPVGIIDHEPQRWGALIHGVRVMGGATDIAMAASTHGVEMVLVSLADLDPVVVREIVEACQALELECRLVPALSDMIARPGSEPVREVVLSHEGGI